jgi:class 3 adenylate cyclase
MASLFAMSEQNENHSIEAQAPSGPSLAWDCAACGHHASPRARFCENCGAPRPKGSHQTTSLSDKQAAPERRLITALFCDLVGSSSLAARLDPEEVSALLSIYREICTDLITRYGGYTVDFAGDGIFATFGYPRAVGGEATSATACGLEIIRAITEIASRSTLPGGRDLAVRVGIESGLVVAGRTAKGRIAPLDALVGTAPNTAARLQQLAAPFELVVGDTTRLLISDAFLVEELPQERLQRLEIGTRRAFLVLARSDGRPQDSKRLDSSLIGRDEELEKLRHQWELASSGHGRFILITGEAGIGKSHIIDHFTQHMLGPKSRILKLTCTPLNAATAFFPILEILRNDLVRTAASQGVGHLEKWCASVASGCEVEPELAISIVGSALGLDYETPALPPNKRRMILMALLDAWLLNPRADGHETCIIIIEDLHWSDPSTLELLGGLALRLAGRQCMLLVSCRSGEIPVALDHLAAAKLTLGPLPESEARRFLDEICADDVSLETRNQILERADGVPLFIKEFTLAADDREVPKTLQQAMAARLDALGDAKSLAQYASVLEDEASRDLLARMAGLDGDMLGSRLDRLIAAEVLVPRVGDGAARLFAFRHRLLREAAYESLLRVERRRLHGLAADFLENSQAALTEQRPELLASHRAAADQHAAAVPLFLRAAEQALNSSALQEAERQARRGLVSAESLGWPQSGQAELELRVLLGRTLVARRGYASQEVRDAFERASQLADQLLDGRINADMLRGLVSFYQVRGPLSRARGLCLQFVRLAAEEGDPWIMASAVRHQGWNELCMGELQAAETNLQRALTLGADKQSLEWITRTGHDIRALTLANLSWLTTLRGTSAKAVDFAKRAAEAGSISPHPVSACYALSFAAAVFQWQGHWDIALDHAARSRAIAEDKGLAYWRAMGRVILGRDKVWREDPGAGRADILRGLEEYRQTDAELLLPFILASLADAEEALDNFVGAEAALNEAETLAIALEAYGFVPMLLLRRAALAKRRGFFDEAHVFREQSVRMARAQGAISRMKQHSQSPEFRNHPPSPTVF